MVAHRLPPLIDRNTRDRRGHRKSFGTSAIGTRSEGCKPSPPTAGPSSVTDRAAGRCGLDPEADRADMSKGWLQSNGMLWLRPCVATRQNHKLLNSLNPFSGQTLRGVRLLTRTARTLLLVAGGSDAENLHSFPHGDQP